MLDHPLVVGGPLEQLPVNLQDIREAGAGLVVLVQ
jgi:hypothetical protein